MSVAGRLGVGAGRKGNTDGRKGGGGEYVCVSVCEGNVDVLSG